MKPLSVLILAAGEGTRMKSGLPKVLHWAAGRPLLGHVLEAVRPLRVPTGIVVGRDADRVRAVPAAGIDVRFFSQRVRRGSGDAVRPAAGWLSRRGGDVLVACGDAPLLRAATLRRLVSLHRSRACAATLLTAEAADPEGYGRIRRDARGRPVAIVEHRDASPEERTVQEINSGTYVFRVRDLLAALKRLRPDNAKGEYYLTDVISDLAARGARLDALRLPDGEEVQGVNTRRELAAVGGVLRRRAVERLLDEGVTVVDPAAVYVDADARVGRDSVIEPQTWLLGRTRIGRGCRIGPLSHLTDCAVADGAVVEASFAQGARVGRDARVGPFARLRPGTVVGPRARVGNFVEIKAARLGDGAKVNHLSYVGDAAVGARANIGAGTITCNYDGVRKSRTTIGAGAFIGSNANLVAPVRVGRGAVVGAGSTITRDVPPEALALERAAAVVKRGWARARREKTPDRKDS